MNYKSFFKQDSVKLGIFIAVIAVVFRLIPELLIGHYPIGYDTLTAYTSALVNLTQHTANYLTVSTLVHQNLLYIIFQLTLALHHFNIFNLIKFFGVILYVLLALSTYLMFLKGVKLEAKKSFYITLFYIISLAALRVSWDLFRNELGLIFLNLFLIGLLNLIKRFNWGYLCLAVVSALLVLVSHQIASVLLVFLLVCVAFAYLQNRCVGIFKYLLGLVFVLLVALSPVYLNLRVNDLSLFAPDPNSLLKNQAAHLYLLIFSTALPFIVIGLVRLFKFKKEQLYMFGYWFVGLSFVVIEPYFFPAKMFFLWDRWLYMLALPVAVLSFYGIEYLAKQKVFLPIASEAVVVFFIVAINYQSIPFALSTAGLKIKTPIGAAFPQALVWNSMGEVKNDDVSLLLKRLKTYPSPYILIADNRFSGLFATQKPDFLNGNPIIYTYGADSVNLTNLEQSHKNGSTVLVFDANEILAEPSLENKIIYQTNTPNQIHRYLYKLIFPSDAANN